MFEQTIVADGEKRPWTFLVSVSGQMLVAAVFLVIPLIYTDTLGLRTTAAPPMVFRPVPEPVPLEHMNPTQVATRSASLIRRIADVFRAPTSIPTSIPTLVDEPAPNLGPATNAPPSVGSSEGVPGSLTAVGAAPPITHTVAVTAEQKPVPRGPVLMGGDVQAAKLIKKVIPAYPPLARQARVSGTVRLLGVVAKDGTVQRLELMSGHPLLSQAALEAVRQWVYKPTLLNGQPVEVQAPIDVIFTLAQ